MHDLRQYSNEILTISIACLTVFGVGCSVGWTSPSQRNLLSGNWGGPKLTKSETSWVASSHELGHFIAPIPSAFLAAHVGRKISLLVANFFLTVGWIVVTTTRIVWCLYLARFLFGLAMGIVFTIVPLYVGEVASPRIRGAFTTSFQAMLYFGHLVEFSVGPYVSYTFLCSLSLGLTLFYFAVVFYMVESPHHLVSTNKKESAANVVSWLRKTTNIHAIREEIEELEELIKRGANRLSQIVLLFKKPYRKWTFLVAMVAVAQRFTGMSAIVAYASKTFPSTKGGLTSDQYTILFGLIVFLFTFASAALLDTAGRRPVMLVSCGGCAIAHLITAFYFYKPSNQTWIPFVSISLFSVLYSIGIGPLVNTFQSELFSPDVKELASSVTTLAHAASSFAVTKLFQVIWDDYGIYVNFLIFAASCSISFLFTYYLLPETKQKTLKEVQDEVQQ